MSGGIQRPNFEDAIAGARDLVPAVAAVRGSSWPVIDATLSTKSRALASPLRADAFC